MMALFSGPTEHAANPPETWKAVRVGDRNWQLVTLSGTVINSYASKAQADGSIDLVWRVIYDREARWYAGEPITGWKPWAAVKAEHASTARRLAERGRDGLVERVARLTERLRNEHRAVSTDPVPVDVTAWARWYATTYPSPTSATLSELAARVDEARAEIARMDALVADLVAA